MYERMTDRARMVMALANQEADLLHGEIIETEHMLLGLIKEGAGIGVQVLRKLYIDLDRVRLDTEALMKTEPDRVTPGKTPQKPPAKKVVEYAIEEARSLNHNYVGSEHLLLGLLREDKGVAGVVLRNLGVTLERARAIVTEITEAV